MTLIGGRVAVDAREARPQNLSIKRGRFAPLDPADSRKPQIDLTGCLVLPGLINSHDHLEFNLFPRLGCGPYANYVDWAAAIFHPDQTPIKKHLCVPKPLRLFWGALKNLLSGVTTVSHHNPYERELFGAQFPVRVVKRFGWAHSLHFSSDFAARYQRTPQHWPFLIHAAEGTDALAQAEIGKLKEAGLLSYRTVLIHCVGLTPSSAELLERHHTSIVWCPSSNIFTLNRTLSGELLRSGLRVALGTDSAMTGEGDLIDEMLVALREGATLEELFLMVTCNAAQLLRLKNGEGLIRNGAVADLVAVADRRQTPAEALLYLRPELVITGGKIKLVSLAFRDRLPQVRSAYLERIHLQGRGDYLVDANVVQMYRATAQILGDEFELAGRRVRV